MIQWIKSLFKRKKEQPVIKARHKERPFDMVEMQTQLDRDKTYMIFSKGKAYRVRELG